MAEHDTVIEHILRRRNGVRFFVQHKYTIRNLHALVEREVVVQTSLPVLPEGFRACELRKILCGIHVTVRYRGNGTAVQLVAVSILIHRVALPKMYHIGNIRDSANLLHVLLDIQAGAKSLTIVNGAVIGDIVPAISICHNLAA